MANIQIVTLMPEEWRLYKQFRLESLLREPHAFNSSYAEVLQRPDSHWQERLIAARVGNKSWLLFARENDQIVGMIGAFGPEKSEVVEIISVYVSPEKRGQGIATALMTEILEEVGKSETFRKAVITVNESQTAAVALYRYFGFQVVGEITGIMGDGNSYTGYIMEKDLAHSIK